VARKQSPLHKAIELLNKNKSRGVYLIEISKGVMISRLSLSCKGKLRAIIGYSTDNKIDVVRWYSEKNEQSSRTI